MKLFSGSKNSSLILLVALVAALLFAIFYYVVLPKKNEAELTQSSISSLQTEITTIQDQINNLQSEQVIESNTFALRKKLPQNRQIDQLLLNIEEIEYISGTRVLNINFNNYDSLVSETLPEEEATEETTEQPAPEENADTEEVPTTSIDRASIPNELKLITFTVDVEAPNARSLQQFIEEVENLERIMHIDTISFALPGEESVILNEDEDVSVSLQVTTFYYEGE